MGLYTIISGEKFANDGCFGSFKTSIRVPPKNLELIFLMCLQDSALRKMVRNTAL
jgi:hypothetical protein